MKNLLLLLSLSFILWGCEQPISENLIFKQEYFHGQSNENCQKDSCTTIDIEVPIITNADKDNTKDINQATLATITDLMSFESDLTQINSYQGLIDTFLQSYDDFIEQYPDETMPWKASVKATNTFVNDSIYALKIDYYTFAGGAYGYQSSVGLIFDLQNGQIITPDQLFNNWAKVMTLIEPNLPYAQQLKDKNGILAYPEQIFLDKDKITFGYCNSANFPISSDLDLIEVPMQQIKPYLSYDITPMEVVWQK